MFDELSEHRFVSRIFFVSSNLDNIWRVVEDATVENADMIGHSEGTAKTL